MIKILNRGIKKVSKSSVTALEIDSTVLINVQLLRFVAAAMVLLYHGALSYASMGGESFLLDFRYIGFSGVDVFFVISGFIICYTNRDTGGVRENSRYLYRRLCRVYLGYWPFFFLMWLLLLLNRREVLEQVNLLTSFFLVWDVPPARMLRLSWTLSFELYFYSIFFLLLFTPYRYRIIFALFVFVLAFNLYIAFFLDAYTPSGFRRFSKALRFFTHPFMLEFFMGCFVALAIERGWRRFANTAWLVGVAMFLVALALNMTLLEGSIAKYYNYHLRVGIFGIASALIVYGLVNCESRGKVLLPKLSLLLGGASYSLYLCHVILLRVFKGMGVFKYAGEHGLNPEVIYILVLLFIVAFSVAFYKWIERPLYQFAKNLPARLSGTPSP